MGGTAGAVPSAPRPSNSPTSVRGIGLVRKGRRRVWEGGLSAERGPLGRSCLGRPSMSPPGASNPVRPWAQPAPPGLICQLCALCVSGSPGARMLSRLGCRSRWTPVPAETGIPARAGLPNSSRSPVPGTQGHLAICTGSSIKRVHLSGFFLINPLLLLT